MTPRRALVAAVIALAVVLGLASPARAGAASDQLQTRVERVLKILENPELRKESRTRERRAAIRQVAGEIFDFTEITRRSLGRHWAGRTAAEREEMVQLMGELLEYSYVSKIELYSGEKVAFVGESLDTDQATVRTRIVPKQGPEIAVDYRLGRRDDRWLAYDVSVEGISLVANYRTQFDRIIQKSSYEELVKKLRQNQAERVDGAVAARGGRRAEGSGSGAAAGEGRPRPLQSP